MYKSCRYFLHARSCPAWYVQMTAQYYFCELTGVFGVLRGRYRPHSCNPRRYQKQQTLNCAPAAYNARLLTMRRRILGGHTVQA